ncbi:MAG: NAD-dependent epimerase/dehydratase family protein [Armatimonas sp.]
MKALVTGASGCLGWALCERLKADSRITEVRGLVRRADAELPEGVLRCIGELSDSEALKAAAEGVDLVFHLAAQVHTPEATSEAFHEVNVTGTGRLLDTLDPERPPRVVFFSTVAVYGEDTPPQGISEQAAPAPVTPYAKSKLAAEKLVRRWADDVGALAVILRVATVYGPRDRGNMIRMIEAIHAGKFVLPGGGENRKTVVAARNVAEAALTVAFLPSVRLAELPPVVVADAKPVTVRELAQAMGGNPKSMPLRLSKVAARLLGKSEQVKRLAADNVYLSETIRKITGYSDAVTLSEGMSEAVAWWREHERV